MGRFIKDRLPPALDYYEGCALILTGRGAWRTTRCEFHGGSDSMRIHLGTGAYVCMSCGEKGGDVLAYHMRASGLGFVEAARKLGAYEDDGKPHEGATRPNPISARLLLQSVAGELMVACMVASDCAKGRQISEEDWQRLKTAAARITYVAGIANAK